MAYKSFIVFLLVCTCVHLVFSENDNEDKLTRLLHRNSGDIGTILQDLKILIHQMENTWKIVKLAEQTAQDVADMRKTLSENAIKNSEDIAKIQTQFSQTNNAISELRDDLMKKIAQNGEEIKEIRTLLVSYFISLRRVSVVPSLLRQSLNCSLFKTC